MSLTKSDLSVGTRLLANCYCTENDKAYTLEVTALGKDGYTHTYPEHPSDRKEYYKSYKSLDGYRVIAPPKKLYAYKVNIEAYSGLVHTVIMFKESPDSDKGKRRPEYDITYPQG